MSKYFIAAIGRSGTKWLSSLLNSAEGHTCEHERPDKRSKVVPQPWTPFPVERWDGRDSYGECSGMLRYHLSGQHLGTEMAFAPDCRVYLRRDPMDIIASWMQAGRSRDELSATCHEVLWHAQNLENWAVLSGSRIVDVESLWRSRDAVQALVDSLGLRLEVVQGMMAPMNVRAKGGFEWDEQGVETARRAATRVGARVL